jgi:hypothetical protein
VSGPRPGGRATDEVAFAVVLTPRGGADRIEAVVDGALRVRVAAPAVEGAANAALVRLVARELDVPAGAVRIVTGAHARRKVVAVRDLPADRVSARWPGLTV